MRVWQLSVETLLAGGLATLPLAPIADVPQDELPQVIKRMRERIEAEPKESQQELWASTYFLLGAKYPNTLADQLLKGIGTMFESTTYNATLEKGRAQGVAQGVAQGLIQGELRGRLQEGRELIYALGRERLGEPTPETVARLESIATPESFPTLIKRVAAAKSWADLFAT